MKIYVVFTLEKDAELEEWPIFDSAFSTKEGAEAYVSEKLSHVSSDIYSYKPKYEIEEEELQQ